MAWDLTNAHQQVAWSLGLPWVNGKQTDGSDGAHIERISPTVRHGYYTYGVCEERTRAGVVELWPLTQANNPFTPPA